MLKNPEEIRRGSKAGRFIMSSSKTTSKTDYLDAVVLEIVKVGDDIIVTVFPAKKSYLENFELLWRATVPPSQQGLRQGGNSLSALKATRNSQNNPLLPKKKK